MKIMVLGGGGFIGHNFIRKISSFEHEIYSFDRMFLNSSDQNVKYIKGDFAQLDKYKEYFENTDILYHFISTTLPKESNLDPVFDIKSNLCNLINLLNICINSNVKKIVFISSGGTIYGEVDNALISENEPTNPLSSYGIVKLAMEKYIQLYGKLYNLKYSIFRLSNPYGPYQNSLKGQGLISILLKKILQNEEIIIWGDGSAVRDYIYIDDVIVALYLDLIKKSEDNVLFNLGSGNGTSINNILEILEQLTGNKVKVLYENSRNFDVKSNVLDISKINKFLNWRPEVDIFDGIEQTYNWLKNNKSGV